MHEIFQSPNTVSLTFPGSGLHILEQVCGWNGTVGGKKIGAATGNIGGRERRPPKKSDVPVARETTCRGKLGGRGKRSFPRSGRPLETSAAENDGRRRRATLPLRGRRLAGASCVAGGNEAFPDRGGHWKHRRPRTTAAEEEIGRAHV